MTTPDPAATLEAAARLESSMDDLKGEISTLRTYGQHNRRMIWAVVVSLALNVILLVLVGLVALQANSASSLANRNKQDAITNCNAGNQARAVSTSLWNYVLNAAESNPQNQTPEAKKQIADFKQYLAAAYAPRDCTQVGGS